MSVLYGGTTMSISKDNKFWILLDFYGQNYYRYEYHLTDPINRMYEEKFRQCRHELIDYIDEYIDEYVDAVKDNALREIGNRENKK